MAGAEKTSPNEQDYEAIAPVQADVKSGHLPETRGLVSGPVELVEKLERAVERAVGVISQVESSTAKIDRQQAALKRQFAALEQGCAKAEEVQLGLMDFVSQLAEVGDSSQEKISLLMDGLEAGNKARHDLKKAVREVSHLQSAIESRMIEHERRLGETIDAYLAKASRAHEAQLTQIKQTLVREFEPFGTTGEQTLRLTELVKNGIASINRNADQREGKLHEALETQAARLASTVREFQKQITQTADQCVATVQEAQARTVAELKSEAEHQIAAFGPTGEHARHLVKFADSLRASMADARTQSVRKLQETVQAQVAQFNEAADTKIKQLASQLQCSREAVRMLSESSAEGHRILSALVIKQEGLESQIKAIDERSKRATRASNSAAAMVVELQELQAKVKPDIAAMKNCLDGSDATIKRIESLIQDVWTLTTTARDRARQVSERTKEADQVIERIQASRHDQESLLSAVAKVSDRAEVQRQGLEKSLERAGGIISKVNESVVNAAGVSDRVAEASDTAGELVCDLGVLIERGERTMEQVKAVCDSASQLASMTVQRVKQAETTAAKLTESVERADKAITSMTETVTESDAAVDRVTVANQSAQETIRKLEGDTLKRQAVQDEWHATIEAGKQIAEDLSETLSAAATLKKELAATVAGANDAHRDIAQATSELVGNLEALIGRSEQTIARIESICESASKSAAQAVQRVEHAKMTSSAAAAESIKRTDAAVASVSGAVKEAQEVVDRVASSRQSARKAARELESCTIDQQRVTKELRSAVEKGARTAKELAETISTGSALTKELATTTAGANEANREVSQLLAAIVEHRGLLETSEQAVNLFAEQSEALRVKWQQLETRADAFGHQLNSMLAQPTKIVAEAKTQASQLDGVCKAVRKIFAGLSQASLQANRDISKFGQISHEANGRLAKLSAQTKRATQTLREWVEEAAHAQSRLSRSLAQIPTIEQTHPTTALEDLGRMTSETLPGTIRPNATRRPSQSPPEQSKLPAAPDLRKRSGGRDLADLIHEAELASEASH